MDKNFPNWTQALQIDATKSEIYRIVQDDEWAVGFGASGYKTAVDREHTAVAMSQ